MMVHDGFICSFKGVHMGIYGISIANEFNLSQEEQDEWALESNERAIKVMEAGKFADEIVHVTVSDQKGDNVHGQKDEEQRKDTTFEKLAAVQLVFNKTGTITAGNAPNIRDGAEVIVLMSDKKAEILGKKPHADIVAHEAIA